MAIHEAAAIFTKENEELRAAVARQTRKRDQGCERYKKVFLTGGKGLARVQAAQHGVEEPEGRMNRQPEANVI
ncbi:uncharacterized protein PADG_08301 [Paracoccidioides brasiliensis Pb18]|uniref:Uncharacterized protein n=2 Tax=Paracoccidioides brasiliensis TaxID=121759 RepID=C1GLR0_PARBD|nr:uncharacterized protein PADG_08301 [Paracoccidioides brasiliensis Pb18]EEH43376.2 hypothetical protein PADG_08301 [Paracoccidioides brasiliensis Pb18]ODH12582.1 hypothetical protein ACO22_08122 [Paracoccidioides brasiliensis]ODH46479.1 hypothetical protein GX48_07416 [Paracoccidioides brasiliensis]